MQLTPNAPEFYSRAYDVLVELGGAPLSMKADFVRTFTQDDRYTVEWRFQGKFGFGGKFWRRPNGHDTTCYSEDLTKKLGKLLKQVNDRIADLERELQPVGRR